MKKIIIISLIAILITAFSYAQSKRKYTDTALRIDPSLENNIQILNNLFKDGWKFKNGIGPTTRDQMFEGMVLIILTKPLKSNEEEK